MIVAIIGSILIIGVIVLYILLFLGFPYGEYAMGGSHKVYPPQKRVVLVIAIALQLVMILTLLQANLIIDLNISQSITKVLCYVFAVYLSLNVLANLASKSKKERLVMTPMALITAVCFWITIYKM